LRRGTVLIAAEERPELNYYSNGDTLTRGGLVGSIPEWLLHGNLAATTIWLQVAASRLITDRRRAILRRLAVKLS